MFTGRPQTVGRKKLGKNFLADGAVDGGRKLDNLATERSFSGVCDQCIRAVHVIVLWQARARGRAAQRSVLPFAAISAW